MRATRGALASVLATALAAAASGNGQLDTTGATIAPGTAATQGSVFTDACAPRGEAPAIPAMGTLGSLGTFSSALPAFGGGGTGVDGIFAAVTPQDLPAATYNFSSYTVGPGVVVTYDGPVTILTTGDVRVDGTVRTNTPAASITIRCGGNFVLGAGGRVRTDMMPGDVTLDVAGGFTGGSASRVDAITGDVTLLTHGAGSAGDITLGDCKLNSSTGDVVVQASGGISTSGDADVNTSSGDVLVQAFGGDATFTGTGQINLSSAAADGIRVEAAGAIEFGAGQVNTSTGDIDVRAFGGDVAFLGSARANTSSGDIALGASGSVRYRSTANMNTSSGSHRYTAFGGDVLLEPQGGSIFVNTSTGDIELSASRDVVITGGASEGRLNVSTGNFLLRAVTGDVRIAGPIATNASAGSFEIRAGGLVTLGDFNANHDSVLVSAGPGGVLVDTRPSKLLQADVGALTVVSSGPVSVAGRLQSRGALRVASYDQGITIVSGTTLATDSLFGPGFVTGDVRVESFADAAGTLNASGAVLRTGNADDGSGDVVLAVRQGRSPPAADAYVLPQQVSAKIGKSDPAKSKLVVSGVLDTGGGAPSLAGPFTLSAGDLEIAGTLVADSKGKLSARSETFQVSIKPPATGSSRAAFNLKLTGDFRGFLDEVGSGPLLVRLQNASVDAIGTVTLTKGKFKLGKKAGALLTPSLFVSGVKAKLAAAEGADSLKLVAGLASLGAAPATSPEVTVSFGDVYSATIPAGALEGSKGVFKARSPIPGVASVTLDYAKEQLVFVAKGVELGSFPADASFPVVIRLRIGEEERAVRVRVVRSGASLAY